MNKLVDQIREMMPTPTVRTDREHPSYARRGSKDVREKVRRAMAQEADTPLVKGGTGPEPRDRRPMTTLAEGKKPTRKQNHGTPGS